jgi:hypothetical protein
MMNEKDLKVIDLCLMFRRAQLNRIKVLTPTMQEELDDLNEAIPKIREMRKSHTSMPERF